ncbi:MAG: DUF1127 domain-containing protein [Terasakiella sp.]|uniref:DUF1127 domain-containing protein n=1 Tax=unclassified Terasakiella TaxID=2614952 RepID=UPI003B0034DB
MSLPYPITSYGSRHVELTGGLLTRFEDFVIAQFSKLKERHRIRYEMNIMSDRELKDLGMTRSDIALLADGKFNAIQDQRR